MKFTKMTGCGNDYVYVNGFIERVDPEKKPDLVRWLSNRNFGIGSDGVIFINQGIKAPFEMEMYNADGTRAEMCGNGIRCVAKYIFDHEMCKDRKFEIESFGSVKYITVTEVNEDGKAKRVKVDMGSPILKPAEVPVTLCNEKEAVIGENVNVLGNDYAITCVSMGNPHAVTFMDSIGELDLESIGPKFENNPIFPNRTNTEFVKVKSRDEVDMRVWERGTGETLACGTGCCATAVACILNGLTDETVKINVLGGQIIVNWDRENNKVFMEGPAVTVFEGEIEINGYSYELRK